VASTVNAKSPLPTLSGLSGSTRSTRTACRPTNAARSIGSAARKETEVWMHSARIARPCRNGAEVVFMEGMVAGVGSVRRTGGAACGVSRARRRRKRREATILGRSETGAQHRGRFALFRSRFPAGLAPRQFARPPLSRSVPVSPCHACSPLSSPSARSPPPAPPSLRPPSLRPPPASRPTSPAPSSARCATAPRARTSRSRTAPSASTVRSTAATPPSASTAATAPSSSSTCPAAAATFGSASARQPARNGSTPPRTSSRATVPASSSTRSAIRFLATALPCASPPSRSTKPRV